MRKIGLIILVSFLFVLPACNTYWTATQKRNFLTTCEENAVTIGEKAHDYCDCLQKKVEAKYPNINKANKMSQKEKEAMTIECLK